MNTTGRTIISKAPQMGTTIFTVMSKLAKDCRWNI